MSSTFNVAARLLVLAFALPVCSSSDSRVAEHVPQLIRADDDDDEGRERSPHL